MADNEKVVTSTLAFVLPEALWPPIQQIRRTHDKSFRRWPPHVNFLYPFVPEHRVDEVVPRLSDALRDIRPFRVTFSSFGHFAHSRKSFTVWLSPEPKSELIEVQKRLERVVPQCNDLSTIEARGYTPHLSVGQWRVQGDVTRDLRTLNAEWKPISCVVDRVVVMTRRDDLPFAVHTIIPFGGADPLRCPQIPYDCGAASSSAASADTGSPQKQHGGVSALVPAETFAWSAASNSWMPSTRQPTAAKAPKTITVATWNVLRCTDDMAAALHNEQRIAETVRYLGSVEADVFLLQEVSAPFIRALSASDWARNGGWTISADPSAEGLACPGVVIASRFPFTARVLRHSKYKQSVIGQFAVEGWQSPVTVAAVHLTSDYNSDKVDVASRRAQQLSELASSLPSDSGPCIVAGDLNISDRGADADSISRLLPVGFVDCWRVTRRTDPGLSFDPSTNPTAAITTKSGSAHRFDRVLLMPNVGSRTGNCAAHLWPSGARLLATGRIPELGGLCPSDHYMVACSFDVIEGPVPADLAAASLPTIDEFLLGREDASCTAETRAAFSSAVDAVRRAVDLCRGGSADGSRAAFFTTGSYLLGVFSASSDIDVLCVSDRPRDAFFSELSSSLKESHIGCRVLRSSLVPVARACVGGVKVEVQYAQVPRDAIVAAGNADGLAEHFAASPQELRKLDDASSRAICGLLDNRAIAKAVAATGSQEQFSTLLRAVKLWATSHGVYSVRMGYPGGIGWALMAARVVQTVADPSLPPGAVLKRFFDIFSSWNWSTSAASLVMANLPKVTDASADRRSPPPMVIWTPTKPHYNVTRNASRSSVQVLRRELASAAAACALPAVNWPALLVPNAHREAFMSTEAQGFVVVTVSSMARGSFSRWCGLVESRLVGLVINLERAIPNSVVRLFSSAFYPREHPHPFSCCYVAAVLTADSYVPGSMDVLGPGQAWEHTVLDGKPADSFLSVRGYSQEKLPRWILADTSTVAPQSEGVEEDSTDDTEDDEDIEAEEKQAPLQLPQQTAAAGPALWVRPEEPEKQIIRPNRGASEKMKKGKKGKEEKGASPRPPSPTTPTGEKKAKLTKSDEIYHRIRWDPAFNKSEWTISFEDRFLGLMEVPFEEFDSENIPMHRVWLFKHRGDVMWDREKRIDRVGYASHQ